MGNKCSRKKMNQTDGSSDTPPQFVSPPAHLVHNTGVAHRLESAKKEFALLRRRRELEVEHRRLDVLERAKSLDQVRRAARHTEAQIASLRVTVMEHRTAMTQRRHELHYQLTLLRRKLETMYLEGNLSMRPDQKKSSRCAICMERATGQPTQVPVFGFSHRRHHCRRCGRSVCEAHSDKPVALPLLGYPDPVRTCVSCYTETRWGETLFSCMTFDNEGDPPAAKLEWRAKAKALGFTAGELEPTLTTVLDIQAVLARDECELDEEERRITALTKELQGYVVSSDTQCTSLEHAQAGVTELVDELHEMELSGSEMATEMFGEHSTQPLSIDSDYSRGHSSVSCESTSTLSPTNGHTVNAAVGPGAPAGSLEVPPLLEGY